MSAVVVMTRSEVRALVLQTWEELSLENEARPVITREECAAILGVTPNQVSDFANHTSLPAYNLGPGYRFFRREVLDWRKRMMTPVSDSDIPPLQPSECAGVYCIAGAVGFVKIGRTENLARRLSELQAGYPYRLRVLAMLSPRPRDEVGFHARFAPSRTAGEWFIFNEEIRAAVLKARGLPG